MSNYLTINAKTDAMTMLDEPVPLNIRNAPTALMKQLNYGIGYQYAHDYEKKMTAMQCLPDSLKNKRYYYPTDQGLETRYGERLEAIRSWKEEERKKEERDQTPFVRKDSTSAHQGKSTSSEER